MHIHAETVIFTIFSVFCTIVVIMSHYMSLDGVLNLDTLKLFNCFVGASRFLTLSRSSKTSRPNVCISKKINIIPTSFYLSLLSFPSYFLFYIVIIC